MKRYEHGSTFFDREGQPIGYEEFERLYAQGPTVEYTEVGDKQVSTVWLGVDYGHGFTPVPLIYETAIFPELDVIERTPTEESARKVHAEVVARLRAHAN